MEYINVLMTKKDMPLYPRYDLPEGFSFEFYKEGYEKFWADIIYGSGLKASFDEAFEIFEKEFLPKRKLLPKLCLFVKDDTGRVVSTASLWQGTDFGEPRFRIHWVATLPEFQGKGIAKAVLSKLLDVYKELGHGDWIYLVTQIWRYKAINVYSKFGFKPYLEKRPVNWDLQDDEFDENNKRAWKIISEKTAR